MRICVPTATDDGLDATVHEHFGSAPYFSILDTETGAVEAVRNANEHHEHGQCNPVGALTGLNPDALVVRGIDVHCPESANDEATAGWLTDRAPATAWYSSRGICR